MTATAFDLAAWTHDAVRAECRDPYRRYLAPARRSLRVWGALTRFDAARLYFVDEASEAILTGDVGCSGRAGGGSPWPLLVGRREVERAVWAVEDTAKLWSEELLTAAALQRYHIDGR